MLNTALLPNVLLEKQESAFIVNSGLRYFDLMIPCGIKHKAATFLNVELGKATIDEAEVKEKLLKHFTELFEAQFVQKPLV